MATPTKQIAPDSAVTLADVLHRHAETEPDRAHIHLREDQAGEDISYGRLLGAARAVAAGLAAGGLGRNDTVAIMLPTGADFFYAFCGVMLAGGIPVPIYPPTRPDKIEEYVRRQVQILRNAEVRFLITFDRVKAVSQLMRPRLPSLIDVATVESLRRAGEGRAAPAVAPAGAALIQYTSGSTGDPKGVFLSHANVLANIRGIGGAVRVRPDDVVVSWLPLYHDMGLIGAWLFSLYYATPITVLSPLAFLGRPERWLWALHHARGTLCPAPNFAYELCVRKIQDRAIEGLDLSSWRVAINAGEAVLPETIARFTERFGKYGFRAASMLPCYGMAESSVALAFPPIGRVPVVDSILRRPFESEGRAIPAGGTDENVVSFVSVGKPLPLHEVRMVDEQQREAGERRQGRILFRGPSKTAGYYRNPAATEAAVNADGWMDSGDLGYWAGGELYITGRRKDCIIKSGRNIIPQEVEAAASKVPGVRQGCVAAFGMADPGAGTERLVVVAETRASSKEERRRIKSEIVKSVGSVLGIAPDRVHLAPPKSIPKTSSGKIRRNATRALLLSGKLQAGMRPAWVQMVRLGAAGAASWLGLTLGRAGRRLADGYTNALLLAACGATGALIRLLPRGPAASRVFRVAARCFLRLSGQTVSVQGAEHIQADTPAVFFANRAGRLDALTLGAALPVPFVLAGERALSSLPRPAAALLRPLLVAPLEEAAAPKGGSIRQRIRRALQRGHSVVVVHEGSVGQPAALCRFRLGAFHAAAESASRIYPLAVTSNGQGPRKQSIVIGASVKAWPAMHGELAGLREQVRQAIARNCEPAGQAFLPVQAAPEPGQQTGKL